MGGRIITGTINCSNITVNKDIITEYSNSNTAIAEGTKELEVTVNRREYSIVGDELYIPKRYEDAPQWLRDIIDTVTSTAISSAISDVSTLGDMLDGLIAELNVAKNTYTMSIISDNSINERINLAIETLNSSLADADSTILDVAMTRVTPEEAQTIALGILSASINGGDISAAVQNLQSAIADVDSARALDYTRLNASISDEFESTATAISTINAYVGIDEAGASTGTGLSAYLEDSNGVIGGADSELNNTIKVTAEGIESKFEYNSIVNINGVYKKSGFGLTTNYTSGNGTEANPYVSEFWIDASRLKFTNSNVTGQVSPFTIDASGTTPQVTFNGKVAFGNVNGANMSGSNLLYNSAPAIGFETKGWQADYNDTGISSGGLFAAGDPYRPTGGGAFHQYIPGTPAVGRVFDIKAMGAIPVIGGQFYEGSAYLNSHRCNSQIYVGWIDSAGTIITWSMGDIVTQTDTTNVLATWGRSKFITQAPANAVSCYYYIRGISTGQANPYVFVSMCYFGRASEGQSVFSSWSEGISASLSSSDVSAIANSAVNNISWQSEVQTAINNNATYIDGGKIVTNTALVNSLNAVGGIVADYVNANEFNGMTFNGGIFNGARINGAVIKASYLDLDGELEVLTNYHISVATYNANPSLYSDAVYISADNEYRIPSYSVIKESSVSYIITSPITKKGVLHSYSTANIGTNNKAVKINPSFLATSSFQLIRSVCADTRASSTFNSFILSMGGVNLLTYSVTGSGNNINVSISGTYFTTKSFSFYVFTESSYSNSWTVDIGFATISLSYVFSAGTSIGSETFYGVNAHTLTATVNTGQKLLPFNWNNANPIIFQQIATPYSRSVTNGLYTQSVPGSTTFSLNQSLQINNMI